MAGIKLAGETLGTGLQEFLGDKDKMVAATATLTAMALGIYTARTGTGAFMCFVFLCSTLRGIRPMKTCRQFCVELFSSIFVSAVSFICVVILSVVLAAVSFICIVIFSNFLAAAYLI